MMKRFISIVLALVLTLSFTGTVAFAETKKHISESQLFIETYRCPQEYMNYAEANISGFVESCNETEVAFQNITVGNPFSFTDSDSDVYYFPVICDGCIEFIFRVYPDNTEKNGFSAAISSFLADELEKLAPLTSASKPMKLTRDGNKIIATIASKRYVLFSYPEEMNDSSVRSQECINSNTKLTTSVINVKAKSEIGVTVESASKDTNSWSYYINLNITETQGSNNWCAAYCTATILRTLGYNSTAAGVMSIFYRRPSSSDNLSREQVVSYANMRGLNPIRVEATVSNETLINNLRSNRPVYLSMAQSGGSHAVVLRGYNSRRSTWSIWNPWFTSYETFSMGGVYVPTGYSSSTYSYRYARTIYRWAP